MPTLTEISQTLIQHLETVVLGKHQQLQLSLCCLYANGYLLIEDLPGMGKTTLSQGIASVFGFSYKRVQFTSDLLPADILGATVYDKAKEAFSFHPGPIFCQLLLADELNRATPKAQSALLEAMEERQISIEGVQHPLPRPFFVIATQNSQSQTGTYALPESQLDRFLMRLSLGYPDETAERSILLGEKGREHLGSLQMVIEVAQLQHIQQRVTKVGLSNSLLDYVQRLVKETRNPDLAHLGLSPRGALSVVRSAQAWALMHGRQHVLPEDVQAVFVPVSGHRMIGKNRQDRQILAEKVLHRVAVL